MKLSSTVIILLVLVIPLNASGCTPRRNSEKDRLFSDLYPDCAMNTDIRFSPTKERYEFNDLIYLTSVNFSEKTFIFPSDSNVRILSFDETNNQWIELRNEIKYYTSPDPYRFMSPASDPLNHMLVTIVPAHTSDILISEIRVVIFGHVYEDETQTSECAGSYIDIPIDD